MGEKKKTCIKTIDPVKDKEKMNIPEIDCPERPYLDKDIEKINFLNKNYYKIM